MPTYLVTDPDSGKKVKLTGDSPPTESELHQIFASVGGPPKEQPGPVDRMKEAFMSIPKRASQAMGGGLMGQASELALGALPKAMGMDAKAQIPGVQTLQEVPGQAASALGARGVNPNVAAAITLPGAIAADMLPKTVGEAAFMQAAPKAIGKGLDVAKSRIVPAYRQIFGVAEQAIKRVLERGASKVLQSAASTEAREEAELRLVQRAQNALVQNRRAAGQAVDTAAEAVSMSREGDKLFDLTPIAQKFRANMDKAFRPGVVANAQTMAIRKHLEDEVLSKMESGLVSGRDLIAMRKQLDRMVNFIPGAVKPIDKEASAFIKIANDDIRGAINNAYPELGKANAEFGKAAKIYGRFRKIFGGQSASEENPLADLQAVQRIRAKFLKSKTWGNVIAQFDKHIKTGEGIINKLYDSLAAREFNLDAPAMLSPSSTTMRSAATLGLTSPKVGAALLRAGVGAPVRSKIKKSAALTILPLLHRAQEDSLEQ